MQLFRIKFLYFGEIALVCCLLAVALALHVVRPAVEESKAPILKKRLLPQNAFQQNSASYSLADSSLLALLATPPKIRLPDLRPHLLFNGRNGRPDCSPETQKIYFSFQGSKECFSCIPGEKVKLRYDKKQQGCKYVLEQSEQESLLWFTATPNGNEVEIRVCMVDEEGEQISGDGREVFALQMRDSARPQMGWELGKWRVDGTLLARQKARWVGSDKFFEKYGGEEFFGLIGKQRIDFGDGEEAYALFAAPGDSFVWEEERWRPASLGDASQDKPLLTVKKVEERVMQLELWDVEGKAKMAMNLIRMPEAFASRPITEEFRFVGARTKTKVLFEVNRERMILKPDDWLVLTADGWKKLATPDEIDAYVERKLVGPLFIFEGISRKEDKQVMLGTLVAPNRTEIQNVEIALHSQLIESAPSVEKPEGTLKEENPIATHH